MKEILSGNEAIARGARGTTEMVLLPDCGHSPHKDQPAKTLQAMAGFARRIARSPEPEA